MNGRYRLEGKQAVPCPDLFEWATAFGATDRQVALDDIGPLRISTVFLGLDHSFGHGPPLLFETIIFDGVEDAYQARSETWEQAERAHAEAVAVARARLAGADAAIAPRSGR